MALHILALRLFLLLVICDLPLLKAHIIPIIRAVHIDMVIVVVIAIVIIIDNLHVWYVVF